MGGHPLYAANLELHEGYFAAVWRIYAHDSARKPGCPDLCGTGCRGANGSRLMKKEVQCCITLCSHGSAHGQNRTDVNVVRKDISGQKAGKHMQHSGHIFVGQQIRSPGGVCCLSWTWVGASVPAGDLWWQPLRIW